MNPAGECSGVNYSWSRAFVEGLVGAGLQDLVLSPGFRSSPLALAFLRRNEIRCHVILDERSAAFFALGMALASGRAVGLLCTSGSAPGNWFPAVIEASLASVPLLLLSAARPAELTGWGANQTVDQQHLFGHHVRAFHAPPLPADLDVTPYLQHLAARALAECRWPCPGPVHLNLAFREPLLPTAGAVGESFPAAPCPVRVGHPQLIPDRQLVAACADILRGRPGAIVCGAAAYPEGFAGAVTDLAARLGCPILAEPLSNLRFGSFERSRLCVRYDTYLRLPEACAALRPQWVLRFGAFPVAKSLQDWLTRSAAEATQILVASDTRWLDPGHAARFVIQGEALAVCMALRAAGLVPAAPSWLERFAVVEAAVESLVQRDGCCPRENFEGALIPLLIERLPPACRLFCGNSLPIRQLDTYSGSAGKSLQLFGNRGASGIDGNVSTALGIATQGGCVALVGDLTAQHDLTALATSHGLDIVVVVINNGGGGIFDYLPVAELQEFEQAWLTPQCVDLVAAAASFGVPAWRTRTLSEFSSAFSQALQRGGPTLIEVVIDRRLSRAQHRAFHAAAESALRTLWP